MLEVKRRKYRFRFLDASISRIYDLQLMSSTKGPKSAVSLGYVGDELQGQYRIAGRPAVHEVDPDRDDGGLLPKPIVRDTFELWPAKRREVVVDFTRYMDGSPTKKGDVIYLTNTMKMIDGRMWNARPELARPAYKVPLLKIVIGDDAADDSVLPGPPKTLRGRSPPTVPAQLADPAGRPAHVRAAARRPAARSSGSSTAHPFDPTTSCSACDQAGHRRRRRRRPFNLWGIRNGGGGWVHPMHLHLEEHRRSCANNKDVTVTPDPGHPDDTRKDRHRAGPERGSSTASSGPSSASTWRTATTSPTRTTP